MTRNILVINAGSSSVKFALFELGAGQPLMTLKGQIFGLGTQTKMDAEDGAGHAVSSIPQMTGVDTHDQVFQVLINWLEGRGEHLSAIGHRVVHGGSEFSKPVVVDAENYKSLQSLISLAPHHQPHNLAGIDTLRSRFPSLSQVACFDTAFHSSIPAEAFELGLPKGYAERGLRRYGFHGSSYEYVAERLPEVSGKPLPSRLVIAHLGNGASMCAIKDGKSIATTMGFSTLDGIPMGTRSGAIDPGVLLHLMRQDTAGPDELEDLLYNKSGMLGVSGISSDMRELLDNDTEEAKSAVEYYCYRITRELGSLAAALGGLDALVFTGGVGENASQIRSAVLQKSEWLGFRIDDQANQNADACITSVESKATAWVIPTNEELSIALHTQRILNL